MPSIGSFKATDKGGYTGQIRTLSIRAAATIMRNPSKKSETQPDFRILSEGVEIGAAWHRRGETSGKEYISVLLAAPEFGPRRIYGNLVHDAHGQDDDFALLWNPLD
ncbi:DUF736 domain-containing protein [Sphingobium boeckii]|uniref:Uncharacterized protein (DUF736 family) n=1 Tax=Sphingobium boeckii TaxID=1082345 RepID=A0A7W9EEJ0_9SPHN|nr:DUF736 domain-containing protein [Sphingobium boeckii]MBB5686313.1 uncharacterized protein (DUF736 family) [Sphingobium boeckii]